MKFTLCGAGDSGGGQIRTLTSGGLVWSGGKGEDSQETVLHCAVALPGRRENL